MRRQIQIQKKEQVQLTAHQKILVLENFHFTIEALEEYIEKTGYYPDFKNRKQIFKESVNDASRTSAELADDFLTQLFCFKAMVNNKPKFFQEEIKVEFYKWINAVGINVNNCPQELRHYLFEINEILEGRGDKIVEQTRQLIEGVEINPRDLVKLVGVLQKPLNDNREKGEFRKGKNYRDIEVESRFNGDAKQGDIAFNQMAWEFNHEYFDFFPELAEKKRQRAIDDLAEYEREEEEKETHEQLNKKRKIDEVKEVERLVKEKAEREKLETERQAQVEISRKKVTQEQAKKEKEELVEEQVKAFSQVQAYWSEKQDEQQKINGQSIHEVLGNDWKKIILTAENKVHVGVYQNLFNKKIDDAMTDEAKKLQEKEAKGWETKATIDAINAYGDLLDKIEKEENPAADFTEQINALDWGRLHGKNTKENLEDAWMIRHIDLATKSKKSFKNNACVYVKKFNQKVWKKIRNFREKSKGSELDVRLSDNVGQVSLIENLTKKKTGGFSSNKNTEKQGLEQNKRNLVGGSERSFNLPSTISDGNETKKKKNESWFSKKTTGNSDKGFWNLEDTNSFSISNENTNKRKDISFPLPVKLAIIGVISTLLISSVVVIKKRLSKLKNR